MLAGKNDAVASETGIDRACDTVASAVAEVGDNIRAGVLVKGAFEMRVLPAAVMQVQKGPNLAQTPDSEEDRQRARQGIQELINDDGVEFVDEVARWSIVRVVGHGPAQV